MGRHVNQRANNRKGKQQKGQEKESQAMLKFKIKTGTGYSMSGMERAYGATSANLEIS